MPYIAQVAVGRREKLSVFGDDYPTPRRHRAARLHPRRGPRRRPRRGADAAGQHRRRRSAPGTSAPATAPASSRCCTRSSAPSAATCRTRWWAAAPATSPRRTPTRARPRPSSAGRPTRTIDDMCADTWRWQRAEPRRLPRRLTAGSAAAARHPDGRPRESAAGVSGRRCPGPGRARACSAHRRAASTGRTTAAARRTARSAAGRPGRAW